MENAKVAVKGNTMTITIDLTKSYGATPGNVGVAKITSREVIDGDHSVQLTAWRKPRTPEEWDSVIARRAADEAAERAKSKGGKKGNAAELAAIERAALRAASQAIDAAK